MTDAEMDRMFEATFRKTPVPGRKAKFQIMARLYPGLTIRTGTRPTLDRKRFYVSAPWARESIRDAFAEWAGQLQPVEWWFSSK